MNAAHLHLMFNHVPLVTFTLALPLLVFALVKKDIPELFRAAVAVVVIGGASSIFALKTGDAAEDMVEAFPGVETTTIHEHEEAAEAASINAIVTSLIAIAMAVLAHKKPQRRRLWIGLTLFFTLVVGSAMARVTHTGGVIRHEESRPGFDPNATPREENL